jgi:hypothetical protein
MDLGTHVLRATLGAGSAVLITLAACGSSDDSGGSGAPGGGGGFVGSGGSTGTGAGGGIALDAGVADAAPPPPEKELESSFRAPVTTSRYVWSTNPDSGRVALIDASSLELSIVEAGYAPTYLAAVSDPNDDSKNAAIVLNALSHDATLLRVDAGQKISTTTLETHQGANSWSVSKDGRWAIAWTDPSKVEKPDPTDGFQDISVLSLEGSGASTRLTVGYRPTRVSISEDGTRAFAITEPGISVIELTAVPEVSKLFEVSDDPLSDPASRDVSITPDGALALVRRDDSPDLTFVDLATGTRTTRTLSGAITDLDLSADGKLALAVVREKSELHLLPIPDAATNPSLGDTLVLVGELVGSVAISENSETAALYTNAVPSSRISMVDLRAGADFLDTRVADVKAPVQALFPSPDGAHLLALSAPPSGSTKAGAFSVVATKKAISPKVVGTDAPPVAVAQTPAPTDRGLIAVRDDKLAKHGVYITRMPSLQVDFIPLASPPLAVGILGKAGKGYVAQQHPEGRITFIDLADGSARTLTGFELGAKVVD